MRMACPSGRAILLSAFGIGGRSGLGWGLAIRFGQLAQGGAVAVNGGGGQRDRVFLWVLGQIFGDQPVAQPGTYIVTARNGAVESEPVTFTVK